MSEELSNPTATFKKSKKLFLLCAILALITGFIVSMFANQLDEAVMIAISVFELILLLLATWFAFKMYKSVKIIQKDQKS